MNKHFTKTIRICCQGGINLVLTEVVFSQLGVQGDKGLVVTWFKNEGECIAKGMPLAEVETNKVTVIVASPTSGVIRKLLFLEEDIFELSEVVALIDT